MPQKLLTSIRLFNGKFDLLPYHRQRINIGRWKVWGQQKPIDLEKALNEAMPPQEGLFKCRVIYGNDIDTIEFVSYQQKAINNLQLVEANNLDYSFKYADRSQLQSLFQKRQSADDILMVKDKQIRDSSYANIALWNGQEWHTPHPPLLQGTRRQYLLEKGIIHLRNIHIDDLRRYKKIRLFNALIPWENAAEIGTQAIKI